MSPETKQQTDSSLKDAFDPFVASVGSHGLALYTLMRSLEFQTPLRSDKFQDLEPAMKKVKADASDWVNGGGTRKLYQGLQDVQTVHGFLSAAIRPLTAVSTDTPKDQANQLAERNLKLWSDPAVRKRVLHNVEQTREMIDDFPQRAKSRESEVSQFFQLFDHDRSRIGGILKDVNAVRDTKEIGRLQGSVEKLQTELSDLNSQLGGAIGATVGSGVGVVAGLAGAGAAALLIPVPGLNLFVCGLCLLGAGAAALFAGLKGSSIQTINNKISSHQKDIASQLGQIATLRTDVAAATYLSSQVTPLTHHMSLAQGALKNEISAWSALGAHLSQASRKAARQADNIPGLLAVLGAMSQLDQVRHRAITMLSMELLPTVQQPLS